jgi:hypothetical protein
VITSPDPPDASIIAATDDEVPADDWVPVGARVPDVSGLIAKMSFPEAVLVSVVEALVMSVAFVLE